MGCPKDTQDKDGTHFSPVGLELALSSNLFRVALDIEFSIELSGRSPLDPNFLGTHGVRGWDAEVHPLLRFVRFGHRSGQKELKPRTLAWRGLQHAAPPDLQRLKMSLRRCVGFLFVLLRRHLIPLPGMLVKQHVMEKDSPGSKLSPPLNAALFFCGFEGKPTNTQMPSGHGKKRAPFFVVD